MTEADLAALRADAQRYAPTAPFPGILRDVPPDLRPGAWLVSLEFEASGWVANLCLQDDEDRPVWLYQVPFQVAEGACDASPLADQAASTSSAGAAQSKPPDSSAT